ncbi:MAG: membrane protein insertase YidC [Acidobacteriota bacterium]|jgi:YidC/Oxa1 family membrane protein insertase|nr:membrane protein insertase YidC [Bryobacteraceae bacterium CoA2 C42]
MADPNPKKELSMEQRLLLAFVLMGVVIFASQYLLPKPPSPPPAAKKEAPAPAKPAIPAAATPASKPAAGEPPEAKAPEAAAATREEFPFVDTDLYRIQFANRGAVVLSWVLKGFKDNTGRPLDLVSPENTMLIGLRPFSYDLKDQAAPTDLNKALFAIEKGADGRSISFTYSDGKVSARKRFRFEPKSYLAAVESDVTVNGAPVSHLLTWRGGFGDQSVDKAYAAQFSLRQEPNENYPTTLESAAGESGPVTNAGNYRFAGLQDAYFAALFLPKAGQTMEIKTFTDKLPYPAGSKEFLPFVGAAVGTAGRNEFGLFVGPKDLELLKATDPRLESVVDWGWFGWIARPLFAMLRWVQAYTGGNWGWAIVAVTVLINVALVPLKLSSMKSMKKMALLQPQIQAINDRYKGVGLNDPRANEKNTEIMDLYKKNNVNPAGGCVPLLLQFPFFIGFYKVLSVATELRGAEWLWVTDLSRPETIALRILPLLMLGSQIYLQKMTPSTGGDPAQQRMMMFMMPVMMAFLFWNASSGLVLYWLTGNVVGIVQQLFFNQLTPSTGVTAAPAAPKKKGK